MGIYEENCLADIFGWHWDNSRMAHGGDSWDNSRMAHGGDSFTLLFVSGDAITSSSKEDMSNDCRGEKKISPLVVHVDGE